MADEKSSAFCKTCNAKRLVVRPGTNHILHLLLSVITFGLWIVVWIFGTIKIGGWRCTVCGTQVPLLDLLAGEPAAEADVPSGQTVGKSGLPDVF
jgi:hypothetical protein